VPVFRDENTPARLETDEELLALGDVDGQARRAQQPYTIYMDAMGFGMGCCCLQVLMFAMCDYAFSPSSKEVLLANRLHFFVRLRC